MFRHISDGSTMTIVYACPTNELRTYGPISFLVDLSWSIACDQLYDAKIIYHFKLKFKKLHFTIFGSILNAGN